MTIALVAYATKYGSTREIAEAVAASLGATGVDTEVRAARDARDIDGYAAVVLGAPLYYFRWNKDARRFLSRHKDKLAKLPVAVFAVGPMNDDPAEFAGAREQLDKALAKHAWLQPRAIEVFGGKFDPAGLRFPDGNPAVRKMPASDIRDWAAIEAWGRSLRASLGL